MKLVTIALTLSAALLVTSCASGLNPIEEREYNEFKQKGVLIEEKNPSTGMALGILPGGGSFYAREPGIGVVNLLLWPLSILWDTTNGIDGSKSINYDMTRHHLKKEKEMAVITDKLIIGEIDNKQYTIEQRKVESKYNYD
jgi:hypothetical protein